MFLPIYIQLLEHPIVNKCFVNTHMNLLHRISILVSQATITLNSHIRYKSHSPICFFSNNFLFSGLVKKSTNFNFDLTNSKNIFHVLSIYRAILCLIRMCLFFPLNILLLALAITTQRSQCIDIDGVGLIYKGISAKRFLSHQFQNLSLINSTFIIDRVLQVCLVDF